jgi:DNA repair protein RecO (recombination protein O)
MSTYFQTLAITLKKQPWKENDCFFTFYTKELGKIAVLAVGAKKIKSKLVSHLEPFGICQISIAQGYFTPRLTASDLVKRFNNVSSNLELIEVAGKCLGLVEKLTKENHRDEKVYELLREVLETLEQKPATEKLKIIYSVFILKLLTLHGFQPELYQCLKCKTQIKPDGNLFSFDLGGLICGQCKIGQEGQIVRSDIIKLLRASIQQDFNDFLKIKISDKLTDDFNKVVEKFLEFRK